MRYQFYVRRGAVC